MPRPKSQKAWILAGLAILVGSLIAVLVRILLAGGTTVNSTATYPFILSLAESTPHGWAHRCNAALIESDIVLTAAHCIAQNKEDIDSGSIAAVGEVLDLSQAGKHAVVISCRCDPRYQALGREYDLGVVRLRTAIGLESARVATPDDDEFILNKGNATAIAFTRYPYFGRFRLTEAPFDKLKPCPSRETQFCASHLSRYVELGDSGGPLWSLERRAVVAVISDREGMNTSRFVRAGLSSFGTWRMRAVDELRLEATPTCTCK